MLQRISRQLTEIADLLRQAVALLSDIETNTEDNNDNG